MFSSCLSEVRKPTGFKQQTDEPAGLRWLPGAEHGTVPWIQGSARWYFAFGRQLPPFQFGLQQALGHFRSLNTWTTSLPSKVRGVAWNEHFLVPTLWRHVLRPINESAWPARVSSHPLVWRLRLSLQFSLDFLIWNDPFHAVLSPLAKEGKIYI